MTVEREDNLVNEDEPKMETISKMKAISIMKTT